MLVFPFKKVHKINVCISIKYLLLPKIFTYHSLLYHGHDDSVYLVVNSNMCKIIRRNKRRMRQWHNNKHLIKIAKILNRNYLPNRWKDVIKSDSNCWLKPKNIKKTFALTLNKIYNENSLTICISNYSKHTCLERNTMKYRNIQSQTA